GWTRRLTMPKLLGLNFTAMLVGAMVVGSCSGDDTTSPGTANGGTTSHAGGSNGTSGSASVGGASGTNGLGGAQEGSGGAGGSHAGSGGGNTVVDAAVETGAADPCDTALLCEKFDSYAAVTNITNNQKFGPWHAALQTGATMNLDSTHKISGSNALHVHIDN